MPTFDEIAGACGPDVARKLWRAFRGDSIDLPLKPRPTSKLSRALGYDDACRLCGEFGPCRLYVPTRRQTVRQRAAAIRRLRAEGLSNREIVRRLRCSERTVRNQL